jgi:hypothetical protein
MTWEPQHVIILVGVLAAPALVGWLVGAARGYHIKLRVFRPQDLRKKKGNDDG